jgi:hypothetical protein
MQFNFELSDQPPNNWDTEILDCNFPEILQTSLFGEFLINSGKHPKYISIFENEKLVGQCLIQVINHKIVTWNYGPIMKTSLDYCLEDVIFALIKFLKNCGFAAIENIKTHKLFTHNTELNEQSDIYSRIGGSPFINIGPNLKEVLNTFDRSVRKNVNKCERNGVEVIISDDTSLLEPYTEMLTWFRASRNFGMPTFFPNNETMKLFNSSMTSMGIALAKFEGRYIAGIGFVTIGKIMTELGIVTSSDYQSVNLPVNEFLKIKAIEYYQQKNIEIYDLAGGAKKPTDPKKQNILKFKQKFTQTNATYGIIDRKVLSAAWYPFAVKRKIQFFSQNTKIHTSK